MVAPATTLLTPCVPVIVEGTAELLVAAEAIERAGLVCVPLDPSSPDERVRRIVEEVGAAASGDGSPDRPDRRHPAAVRRSPTRSGGASRRRGSSGSRPPSTPSRSLPGQPVVPRASSKPPTEVG